MVTNIQPLMFGFAGGLLIGLASTIHLLFKGRITGMSGIFNGIITRDEGISWKSSILSGLLFTSGMAFRLFGFKEVANGAYFFDSPQSFGAGITSLTLMIAGFFVGLGTKLGNGCTSGHGVCGLPRFSARSFAAVMTFMATAMITANTKSSLLPTGQALETQFNPDITANMAIVLSLVILGRNLVMNKQGKQGAIDTVLSFVVGSIFSLGLLVSGMSRKSKVLGFLTLNKDWDMSLMFVMGGAVLLNLFTFNYIIRIKKKPILAEKLSIPTATKIDAKLIIGAALFGLGWGLAGICPGPAMIVTPIYFPAMAKFIGSMAVGQYVGKFIENNTQTVPKAKQE